MNEKKSIYTAKDIQEILGISRPAVYDIIKRGEFHSVMVANKYIVPRKSFDDWLYGKDNTENN